MKHLAARRPRLVLVVLSALLWLPGVFSIPATNRDEARFAQATKQMLETGDFLHIANGPEARNNKPPGIYWLQAPFAAAARATGIAGSGAIWPYRVPSLLGAGAAVLGTFAAGAALGLPAPAPFWSAAFLAATPLLGAEARIAKTDAVLLATIVWALVFLLRACGGERRTFRFWTCVALGILIKGPVGPAVLALTAAAWFFLNRGRALVRTLQPARGLVWLALLVLPPFAALGLATHGKFFADSVGHDLGQKLAGGAESHGGIPGEHLLLLPLLFLPAAGFLVRAVPDTWARRREPPTLFLLCWLVPSWCLFELVPTKLPHYVLPLYPALVLLAGQTAVAAKRPAGPVLARLAALLPPVLVATAALALAALPFALGANGAWSLAAGLPLACVPSLLRQPARPAAALAAAVALNVALFGLALPHMAPLWVSPRAAALVRQVRPDLPRDASGVAACGYAEPDLRFELGTDLLLLPSGLSCAEQMGAGRVAAALIDSRDLPAFDTALRARGGGQAVAAERGRVSGINYSRGRAVTLLLVVKAR